MNRIGLTPHTDLLSKRLEDNLSDKEHKLFGFIANSSNRLLRTVDSILNISQLEAGTINIQPRELDLASMVMQIFNELKPLADQKNLEFNLKSSEQLVMILADEYCIRQAISNIMENALKYTFEGSVMVSLARRNNQEVLKVTDTGIGISKEYQHRIFDAYTQESEGFTKNYQGIGLGLALTKQYLDLNNVALEMESKKDVGSTFTLIFPKDRGNAND
jgi:signal transduction histidine kinase